MNILVLSILIPVIFGLIILLVSNRLCGVIALCATLFNLIAIVGLYKTTLSYSFPWVGFGFDFSVRIYHFSWFILIFVSSLSFLITLYSSVFMYKKNYQNQFYSYLLLTLGFVNGAVLACNLALFLFFWEGLLLTTYGMIAIGNRGAFKTATKAFIITGIGDLCMICGIAMTGLLSGTLNISNINLPIDFYGGIAFVLLIIGAVSKSGSMPFHSWIPDASQDAPLPFMAFLPASLEKLLGIYFLTRISLDMFKLVPQSFMSMLLMIIGAVGLLLAVSLALIQKDYKKLLSYHAISQVGYMVLGIGTAVPVGIVGGLFHMINNALYKSCLYMTAGSVEKQAGTTNLEKLGGLGIKMPVTFICFIITALSISGVPPFNGFFSKELIYDAALKRSFIFYLAAVLGSFFTAASFLKLGHAVFLGKVSDENKSVREVSFIMLFPMIVIALICIGFGVFSSIPINKMIKPILGEVKIDGINIILTGITVAVLISALLNHIYGVKKTGMGLSAVLHLHHAPVLRNIYTQAEKEGSDPYVLIVKIVNAMSHILWRFDRLIDWFYNNFIVRLTYSINYGVRSLHNGSYSMYLTWSLIGLGIVVFVLVRFL